MARGEYITNSGIPDCYKLPEEEVLKLARRTGRPLTIATVRDALGIDLAAAEETLRSLEVQGYVRRGQDEGAAVWLLVDSSTTGSQPRLLTPPDAGRASRPMPLPPERERPE